DGFPNMTMRPQYPIAEFDYRAQDELGLKVKMEAFSPFVPLREHLSTLPLSFFRFTVSSPHDAEETVDCTIAATLRNPIGAGATAPIVHAHHHPNFGGNCNLAERHPEGLVLSMSREPAEDGEAELRPPRPLAGFEEGSFADWTPEGGAFDVVTAAREQERAARRGVFFANSRKSRGVWSRGRLRSPPFTIDRRFLNFYAAGPLERERGAVRLWIDGLMVHSVAPGDRREARPFSFDLADAQGREATIELLDEADQNPFSTLRAGGFELSDQRLGEAPPEGTMALAVVDEIGLVPRYDADWDAESPSPPGFVERGQLLDHDQEQPSERFCSPRGSVSGTVRLHPGEREHITFVLAWHFPQHRRYDTGEEVGRDYARRFADAGEVARYAVQEADALIRPTRLFAQQYYGSGSLPHWLRERIAAPLSTLATGTYELWGDGRPWAFEGVGCCHGTCTHVWNYAQGPARLFPAHERAMRELQDLGEGYDPETGRVAMRGGTRVATDGQLGTVLKVYREHLMSADGAFLERVWPRARKALQFVLAQDEQADGVLRGEQHCTYDKKLVGPNPFVGLLYLAALRAGEEMAKLRADPAFAAECRRRFELGRVWVAKHLFEHDYFVQRVDPALEHQVGVGCLSDQLFGESWARQLGLGPLLDPAQVRTALRAIMEHNWSDHPRERHAEFPPFRDFTASKGGGLVLCSWPHGGRHEDPILYQNEVWTGVEYQLASHLIAEGMLGEGLKILRGIHERYDGHELDPFDEQECGDHYARALASWGNLVSLCGFFHDGPAGRIAFAPKWSPEVFHSFFCASEGWGTYAQGLFQDDRLFFAFFEVHVGRLRLQEWGVRLPSGVDEIPEQVIVRRDLRSNPDLQSGQTLDASRLRREGEQLWISLDPGLVIEEGENVCVSLHWGPIPVRLGEAL
ncbi:MAG: GH116 family glycosyl hydrolase, partial [Planctomycetota bacterium]|nr:GH116 family glycosyl hydrolase [Planctomycetota bacterium]